MDEFTRYRIEKSSAEPSQEKPPVRKKVLKYLVLSILFVVSTLSVAYCIALYNYPDKVADRTIKRMITDAVESGYAITQQDNTLRIEFSGYDETLSFCMEHLSQFEGHAANIEKLELSDRLESAVLTLDTIEWRWDLVMDFNGVRCTGYGRLVK